MKPINIFVAGTGYVGLSMATLLSQLRDETAVDVIFCWKTYKKSSY